MVDFKIFQISFLFLLFFIFFILIILLIRKIKIDRKEEDDNFDAEYKSKKILKIVIFFIIVGGSITFFYFNQFLIKKRTSIFVKELKSNKQKKINLKKEIEKGELSEEIIFSIDDIKYTEEEEYVDMIDIIQQPYESMGIFYEDTDKVLEKRKAGNREYLYNIKGKKRQYTGKLIENIEENKIKVSKYINGFLKEYRIYDSEIEDKNLVQVKRYYKTGNERLDVLYESGKIVQVKESYDKYGRENYKRITSYKNGKKYGEELLWNNDGKKIKN